MTESASPALASSAAIEDAAALIRNAERAVVLTGAGISTPSGIPDFRSEGTGLWSRDEPLEVSHVVQAQQHRPQHFVGHEQVAQVAARVAATGQAGAIQLERPVIPLVHRIA